MADNNNKTDYKKKFMDLTKNLPEPLKSDVSVSIFNNTFNRFLSKNETYKVSGYVGKGNKNAIVSRQIKERTVHRQAFQLQPILYNKIGSVEHMASWKDIQRELERHGIDLEDFSNWGATEVFNFVPPIDINKLINYQDYYWTDKGTPPQYITIRSRCAVATAKESFWKKLINQFGSTFPIDEILPIDDIDSLPQFKISSISSITQEIKVIGDITEYLKIGNYFEIQGTNYNDGVFKLSTSPSYDGITNSSTLTITSTITTDEANIGNVKLRQFDKIVFAANKKFVGSPPIEVEGSGDYSSLFEKDFVVFIRNTSNSELNNSYFKIAESYYDKDKNKTIAKIQGVITDNTSDGEGSLEEQLSIYSTEKNCLCGTAGGWDTTQWDDNPLNPLWGDYVNDSGNPPPDGISDHTNLLNRISNPGPPTTPGTDNELWYDTVNDILYQFNNGSWNIIWNNFSIILEQTKGLSLWDSAVSCDIEPRIKAADQWILENKWLHKNDITNFSGAVRAKQPIIEYDWDLELNEWTYTKTNWAYRSEKDEQFLASNSKPEIIELEPLTWWKLESVDPNNTTIILDDRYGDLTAYFKEGKKIYISNGTSTNIYTVISSVYKETDNKPYRTFITFDSKPLSNEDIYNRRPNEFKITPFETSLGDAWQDYGIHWQFIGVDDPLPVPHQIKNPYLEIPNDSPISGFGSPLIYETRKHLYSQSFSLLQPYDEFLLDKNIKKENPSDPLSENIVTVPLTRRALYGYDDVRVYTTNLNGENPIRQFGTYEEIGETLFHIVGIDISNSEIILGGSDPTLTGISFYGTYFFTGDTILIEDNTGIGTKEFMISSIPPSNSNRIRLSEVGGSPLSLANLVGMTTDGKISNITNPIPTDGFENSRNVTQYVIGIKFFNPILDGQIVFVEVGESTINEFGKSSLPVRFYDSDIDYTINGDKNISLIEYRKVEQVKTKINQYPLFDIYNIDGTPAYKANPIFGYKTDENVEIDFNTGLRIVADRVNNIYEFDQFILEENNGALYAYKDYSNKNNDYWFNEIENKIYFWDEIAWNSKTKMGNVYGEAIVSSTEPNNKFGGLYWFNTLNNTLNVWNDTLSEWIEITNIDIRKTDITLQTIWKGGLNKEQYVPKKVDWEGRSLDDYNEEKNNFIKARVDELLISNPTLTEQEAIKQATTEWYDKQKNSLSTNGEWVGDWEIPYPLYYNNLHENRKYLNSRELLTHFKTIISEQPKIPAFSGSASGMFNLIPSDEVNYAYGGTIKEFNNGFDILLSSTFINNITPGSLFDFAQDQYETQINYIKEIFRKNATYLLGNIEPNNIINLENFVSKEVISLYEKNDRFAFIYGDSTTFTDVDGINDIGIRNWIATLPYFGLIEKTIPKRHIDLNRGINEVVHHDGHRQSYFLSQTIKEIITQIVINIDDERTANEKLGKMSSNLPPNNINEFITHFPSGISNREGVYWYYIDGNNKTLYRYVVVESGTETPSSSYPDGSLWMDLTSNREVLRIKNTTNGTVSWDVVDGLIVGDGRLHNGTDPNDIRTASISAWQEINLDILFADIIYNVEKKLYDNVPEYKILKYNFEKTFEKNNSKYLQYLEEEFLNFITEKDISYPYENVNFNTENPFTWNYKYSSPGGGYNIIQADGLTNSFIISGNRASYFNTLSFIYIKNSKVNDGKWNIILAIDEGSNTRIYVDGDVSDSYEGIIYNGVLPSPKTDILVNNLNDGSESGGYWADFYEKLYNTPYPHLEPWKLQGYKDKPLWWDEEYLNNEPSVWGNRRWKYKHGFEIINSNITDNILTITGNFVLQFITNETILIERSTQLNGNYQLGQRDDIIIVNDGPAGAASIVINDPSGTANNFYARDYIISIETEISPGVINRIKTLTITNTNSVGASFIISVKEEILPGEIVNAFIGSAIYDGRQHTLIKTSTSLPSSIADGRISKQYGMWNNIQKGTIPPGREYPNGIKSITGTPSIDKSLGVDVDSNLLPSFNYFSVNIDNIKVSDNGTEYYNPDDLFPPYWDYKEQYTFSPSAIDRVVRSVFHDYSTEIVSPQATYMFNDIGEVEWKWKVSSKYLYDILNVSYRIDPANLLFSAFGFNFTEIGNLKLDLDKVNTASHTRISFHGDVVNNKEYKVNGFNQWYVNFNRYSGYDTNFSDFKTMWTNWHAPLMYQFDSFIDTPSFSVDHRYVDITKADYEITTKKSLGINEFILDAIKIKIIKIPYEKARYNNQHEWRFSVKTNADKSRKLYYYDILNIPVYVNVSNNSFKIYSWEIKKLDIIQRIFYVSGDQTKYFNEVSHFDISGSSGNDGTYEIVSVNYSKTLDETAIKIKEKINSISTNGLISIDYRDLPWKTGDGVYVSSTVTLPPPLIEHDTNGLYKYFVIKVSDTEFKLSDTKNDAILGNEIEIVSVGVGQVYVGEIESYFETEKNTYWKNFKFDNKLLSYNTPFEIQGIQSLINFVRGYEKYSNENGWFINSEQNLYDENNKAISWQTEIEKFINDIFNIQKYNNDSINRYEIEVNDTTNVWKFISNNNYHITGDKVRIISSNGVYPTPILANFDYFIIRDSLNEFRLAATKNDALNGVGIDIISTAGIGKLELISSPDTNNINEFEINPFKKAIWLTTPIGIIANILYGSSQDIRTEQLLIDQNGNKLELNNLRIYRLDKETKINISEEAYNNNIYLGGLHLFTDGYEHTIKYNNYTNVGNLIYDSFIGLHLNKHEMLFNRQIEFNQRPNVGGYYIETFFNQGTNIKENIESSIDNLRKAYDTYTTFESNLLTQYSRKSLGYDGIRDYLSNINLSEKSQFVFWRGQIQNKGSINAVKAFINSRRFIDAKVDEYWAVKITDFGSVEEKEYPEMYVTTVDARSNESRFEFIKNEDDLLLVEDTFTPIKLDFKERWFNQPDQLKLLTNNGKALYFEMKPYNKGTFNLFGSPSDIIINNGKNYIIHGLEADLVEIYQKDPLTDELIELKEGINYRNVNNNIIEFYHGVGSPPLNEPLIIYGFVYNNDGQNPAKIIDKETNTVITNVQYYDPLRGHYYYNAIHNIDLKNDEDPAKYNITPLTPSYNWWGSEKVGTTWFDTKYLKYVPYHNEKVFPNKTERFRNWGKLAEWSDIKIYEWVESDVHPSEWNSIAEKEEGDRTIPEHIRKSGTAKKTLFKRVGSPATWAKYEPIIKSYYIATSGIDIGSGNYNIVVDLTDFEGTASPLLYIVDVYKNGILYEKDADITSGNYIISAKEEDEITFVQPIPTDRNLIESKIASGELLEDYEYVVETLFDDFGKEYKKYYFWVENKKTKPYGRNRLLSLLETTQQMKSIPIAHMFFQKPISKEEYLVKNNYVNREEIIQGNGSPPSWIGSPGFVEVELPIAEGTEIKVEVNGYDLLPLDYSYIADNVNRTIYINTVLSNGETLKNTDIIKITYIGLYDKKYQIPNRYTQAIIRGLQGIVNADNRYVLRFTRDFTLRDRLETVNENKGKLELKNKHEEWKIFRQEQQYHIDKWQWDKITEAIVGYKLDDPNTRVPSYERELYDEKYGTDTRFGLGEGQAFVDGKLALSTILAYLNDANVDFTPIDINVFFNNYSFDTNENIIEAMEAIYNTFTYTNVNRMYFNVLYDALSVKKEYADIIKTSMVSLHGIRPFQTSGVFDD